MGQIRAYAVPVATLRTALGAEGARRERFRALARSRLAPGPALPDRLGPIHTRVPGTRVVRHDDPTPADLDVVLDGGSVPAGREASAWRVVEALAAGLASSSTTVPDAQVPAGVLSPLDVPIPSVAGLDVGWCSLEAARSIAAFRAWTEVVAQTTGPMPDVVVFTRR